MGGFVAAAQPIVDLLRQRARPYLFSNCARAAVAAGVAQGARDRHRGRRPAGAAADACATLPRRTRNGGVQGSARRHARSSRSCWAKRGSRRTWRRRLTQRGVYVAGFFFPVVPKGQARIRTQMSAALTAEDVDFAVAAFADAGRALRHRLRGVEASMKALVKEKPEPGLWLERRADPADRPGRRAGQGPQDRHLRHRHPYLQLGRVGAEDDPDADDDRPRICRRDRRARARTCAGSRVGQRVSGEGHVIGMNSRAARGGRFISTRRRAASASTSPAPSPNILRVPAFNIVPLPDDVDDELGAILDPLGNAVHTALAFDLVGEDVLITGAGPIGIMAGAVARHVGARHVVITDINPRRLAARRRGRRRRAGRRVEGRTCSDVMARSSMKEGFDVGARDERRAGSLRSDGRRHRRWAGDSRCSASRPSRRRSTGPRSSSSC